jgi:DNA mismatch repair protein MutS2
VEEAARRQKERAPETPAAAGAPRGGGAPVEVGSRVRIESIGATGTVVELREGRATVETAGLRMVLSRDDLSVLPQGDQQPKTRTRVPSGGGYVTADMEASVEVDLRGLRVDELELRLGRALDSALMAGVPNFRIIHGKGTGALRAEVQELLRADPRISAFRPGERYEGGSGVTVVEFA